MSEKLFTAGDLIAAERAELNAIPWACACCGAKSRFDALVAADLLRCPKCKSADLHVADGRAREATEFAGVIPGYRH